MLLAKTEGERCETLRAKLSADGCPNDLVVNVLVIGRAAAAHGKSIAAMLRAGAPDTEAIKTIMSNDTTLDGLTTKYVVAVVRSMMSDAPANGNGSGHHPAQQQQPAEQPAPKDTSEIVNLIKSGTASRMKIVNRGMAAGLSVVEIETLIKENQPAQQPAEPTQEQPAVETVQEQTVTEPTPEPVAESGTIATAEPSTPDAVTASESETAGREADEPATDLAARYAEYSAYLRAIFKPADTICFVGIEHNVDKDKTKEKQGLRQRFVSLETASTYDYFLALVQANDTPSQVEGNSMPSIYVAMSTYPQELINSKLIDNRLQIGRTQENVVEVRALYTDVDNNGESVVAAMDQSTKMPQAPILVETSPGNFQGVWPTDGIEKDEAKPILQWMAGDLGTDSAVAETARVMRVPGFVNRKPKYIGAPLAKLIRNTGVRHVRADFKFDPAQNRIRTEKKVEGHDYLNESFFHKSGPYGGMWKHILKIAGYYIEKKNIDNGKVLFNIVKGHIEANGCYEADGKTPFAWSEKVVHDQCLEVVKKWKTGEEKTAEHLEDVLEQSRKIGEQAAAAIANGEVPPTPPPQPAEQPAQPFGTISPEQIDAEYQKAKEKLEQERAEYAALIEECEKAKEEPNPYPIEAWKGTPYYDFAYLCRANKGGNKPSYIPLEYFVNAVMTVTGAVCGNRITPVFNPTLQARFITVLLSSEGGVGKGEAMEYAHDLYDPRFVFDGGVMQFKNISCLYGNYASGRGMLESAWHYPRLLQAYGELTTLIEKVGIQGSGSSFLDMILNLADRQSPEWQSIKNSKVYMKADVGSKEVSNSVIGGTTTKRMDESMSKVSWETLIQRVNLVPTTETRVVLMLARPDLTEIRKLILPRVTMLEAYRLEWSLSPEALAFAEKWFEDVQNRKTGAESDSETFGRIQTYLWRIVGHLALWLAPLPEIKAAPADQAWTSTGPQDGLVWKYEVPLDVIKRAVDVAEWQMTARHQNMPTKSATNYATVENLIKKWVYRHKAIRWNDLKDRSGINRFGIKICDESLRYLAKAGLVIVRVDPDEPANERKWVVAWGGKPGDYGKKKWTERRGRPSKKAKTVAR
jgi:hypothetical protein